MSLASIDLGDAASLVSELRSGNNAKTRQIIDGFNKLALRLLKSRTVFEAARDALLTAYNTPQLRKGIQPAVAQLQSRIEAIETQRREFRKFRDWVYEARQALGFDSDDVGIAPVLLAGGAALVIAGVTIYRLPDVFEAYGRAEREVRQVEAIAEQTRMGFEALKNAKTPEERKAAITFFSATSDAVKGIGVGSAKAWLWILLAVAVALGGVAWWKRADIKRWWSRRKGGA